MIKSDVEGSNRELFQLFQILPGGIKKDSENPNRNSRRPDRESSQGAHKYGLLNHRFKFLLLYWTNLPLWDRVVFELCYLNW